MTASLGNGRLTLSVDFVRWEGSTLYVAPFDPTLGPYKLIPVYYLGEEVGFTAVSPEDYDEQKKYRWGVNVYPGDRRLWTSAQANSTRPIYVVRRVLDIRHVRLHREVLRLPKRNSDARRGNHKNKHTFDNRRRNLEAVDESLNRIKGNSRRFWV